MSYKKIFHISVTHVKASLEKFELCIQFGLKVHKVKKDKVQQREPRGTQDLRKIPWQKKKGRQKMWEEYKRKILRGGDKRAVNRKNV